MQSSKFKLRNVTVKIPVHIFYTEVALKSTKHLVVYVCMHLFISIHLTLIHLTLCLKSNLKVEKDLDNRNMI